MGRERTAEGRPCWPPTSDQRILENFYGNKKLIETISY